MKGCGHLESTGIDGYAAAVLKFPGDIVAQCSTGVQLQQENVARIYGTDGWILVQDPWIPSAHQAGTVKLTINRGKASEEYRFNPPPGCTRWKPTRLPPVSRIARPPRRR